MAELAPSTLVLFTGGRDSTATVLELVRCGDPPLLFTGLSPFAVGPPLRQDRLREFECDALVPPLQVHEQSVVGPLYELATRSLTSDVLKDGREMLLLGEFVAVLISAIVFARIQGIARIAAGFVHYQSYLVEQHPKLIDRLIDFVGGAGLEFMTPIYDWSESRVRDFLRGRGYSTKSLETTPLFGESVPSDVEDYLSAALSYLDRKLAVGTEWLSIHQPERGHEVGP